MLYSGVLIPVLFIVLCFHLTKGCRDYVGYCGSWARQGYCRSNAAYMQRNCRRSCNLCVGSSYGSSSCTDSNPSCGYWKSIGECRRNPRFMLVSCRRSCGVCRVRTASVWSGWSGWGSCSKSCGNGARSRSRTCSGGTNRCAGVATQQQACTLRPCPVASQWGKWSEWTQCTKTCDKGQMSRSRICVGNLKSCKGDSKEAKFCNHRPCGNPGPPSTNTGSTFSCGKRIEPLMGRVVGGVNAKKGTWPWQIGLFRNADSKFPFCGGTLISPIAVLTAAHCFQSPKEFVIKVGDYDLRKQEMYEKTVSISKVIKHEKYDSRTQNNDVALVILSSAVSFGPDVNAACLPKANEDFTSSCFITGWGRLKQGGVQPTILQQASVPLVSNTVCNKSYKGRILPNMVCAGFVKGGVDACQGDSGGPLVCPRKDGTFVVLGVTSWGHGCAKENFYGVYADVRKYVDWISKSISSVPPPI